MKTETALGAVELQGRHSEIGVNAGGWRFSGGVLAPESLEVAEVAFDAAHAIAEPGKPLPGEDERLRIAVDSEQARARKPGEQCQGVTAETEGAVDEEPATLGCEPGKRLVEENGLMTPLDCVGAGRLMRAQIPRSDSRPKSSSVKGCSTSRFSKRSRFHTTR